jgi:hypothetical protein
MNPAIAMTKNRHDQFAKQYLKGMLSPFSQEIEISFELPPGEPQQVDVWFIPQSRQPIELLGQLGKMVIAPSLIEVFRNPISTEDLPERLQRDREKEMAQRLLLLRGHPPYRLRRRPSPPCHS